MKISTLFAIDKNPRKGLLWMEWAMLAYLVFTLVMMLFLSVRLDNAPEMLWGRFRAVALMGLMWLVYRLIPCRLTMLARVVAQLAMMGWWYPDTYDLNRVLPNLDPVFAHADQWLFGFQPALVFARHFSSAVVSELMYMGYFSYYAMFALVCLWYFVGNYKEFERAAFIVAASFFIFYVIFDLVPVTGPTFYYKAVGLDNIAAGIFPNVGDWFATHNDCLAPPGYSDGLFYHLVEDAKQAGERPTAAFPSSHVGVSTICMLLALRYKRQGGTMLLFWIFLPFYVFLCLATVYIQAHYAIDAIAGFVSAIAIYALLTTIANRLETKRQTGKGRKKRN